MSIVIITGPMFSGKSTELIKQFHKEFKSNKTIVVCKSAIDNRYKGLSSITTHNGDSIRAMPIHSLSQGLDAFWQAQADVLVVDELQFFDNGDAVYQIDRLRKSKKSFIGAGLDTDFRGQPFGCMPELLSLATKVIKLKGECAVCGKKNATMTQRLIDGKPAHFTSPTVMVGASDSYECRCVRCHKIGGKHE